MGMLRKLGRMNHNERAKSKAYKLSRELQHWYASHFLSAWQREKIAEIRAVYESKQKQLDRAHDIASSQLSEEYMQFELDYAVTSNKFKEDNPGEEWAPSGIRGLFAKAFWVNLAKRAKLMGVSLKSHGKTETAQ